MTTSLTGDDQRPTIAESMKRWTPSPSAAASVSCAPQRGMTLEELAAAVDRAPSQLSMIENGHREPKLTLLQAIARALGTTLDALLESEPLDERATLEIAARARDEGPDVPGARHRAVPHRQGRADRGAQRDARAAGRDRAPPRRARRDSRGGAPGERRAAPAHAHAEQLLPRTRGAGAAHPRRGRPPGRSAHAADGIRHRRAIWGSRCTTCPTCRRPPAASPTSRTAGSTSRAG